MRTACRNGASTVRTNAGRAYRSAAHATCISTSAVRTSAGRAYRSTAHATRVGASAVRVNAGRAYRGTARATRVSAGAVRDWTGRAGRALAGVGGALGARWSRMCRGRRGKDAQPAGIVVLCECS